MIDSDNSNTAEATPEAPNAVFGRALTEKGRKPIYSRDEMNLSEFPLTVLSTRSNSNIKTLEFSDKIRGKNGEIVNRSWIITGADKFGLPTSSDDEVLLGLLKLTVDQQFQSRKILFSRYELLKNLRWTTEGRNYSRLQKALDRLSGVRIKATNAFFDNESKSHNTKNFGIVDGYELNDGRDNNRPSFFLWSEVIFKSFQSGFIKKLDLDFYLDLKSAVSKRIYRYLDKHFWYRSKVQKNFFVFAHEKVGVSRTYQYISSIRQQIDPALDELKKLGFIKEYFYQGHGAATEITIMAANSKPRVLAANTETIKGQRTQEYRTEGVLDRKTMHSQAEESNHESTSPENNQSDTAAKSNQLNLSAIILKLVERGISDRQAQRLLNDLDQNTLNRIEKIINHFDYLLSTGSKFISRNPVGFLFKAVQEPHKFQLPEDTAQKLRGISAQAKSSAQTSFGFANNPSTDLQHQENSRQKGIYLAERRQQLIQLQAECEPQLLKKINAEVETALIKLKTLISETRFKEAVEHGVQEKLAKLFMLPDFEEWKRKRR